MEPLNRLSTSEGGPDNSACASSDVIELYVMQRLDANAEAVFEEHLLLCAKCQDRLAETDEFIQVLRAAAKELSLVHEGNTAASRLRGFLNSWFTRRPLMLAASAAALVILAVIPMLRHSSPSAVSIELQTMRNALEILSPQAPSGVPLNLRLDLSELPPANQLSVHLVDGSGRELDEPKVSASDGRMTVSVEDGLPPGRYWVRLTARAERQKVIREYGVDVVDASRR